MALIRTTMSARLLCGLPVFVPVAGDTPAPTGAYELTSSVIVRTGDPTPLAALADDRRGTIVERLGAAADYAAWNNFRLKLCGAQSNACPADLNDDGVVSQPDLGILLTAYGVSDDGDIDRDSDTDVQDLILLLEVYGEGYP